jgi:hypothetical protein
MRRSVLLLGVATLLAGACRMSDEDRAQLFQSGEHTNFAVASDSAVRDLRATSDSGRLIYDPVMNLSARTTAAAGAQQVWAPFGIARPDTSPVVRRP